MFQSVIVKRVFLHAKSKNLTPCSYVHSLQPLVRSSSPPPPRSFTHSLTRNVLFVVMLSCLYVVGRHSLVLTDLMLKGACNQGRKVCNSLLFNPVSFLQHLPNQKLEDSLIFRFDRHLFPILEKQLT